VIKRLLVLLLLVTNQLIAQTGSVAIRVQATGHDEGDAKHKGFELAVEQAFGVLILGETEIRNHKVFRDEIKSFSSGYVNGYQIHESHNDGFGQWYIDMTVEVASSKIAQRMMARTDSELNVNGAQLQAQVESRLEHREQGDALLWHVMSSYPQQAFMINSGGAEFAIDNRRRTRVTIPFLIEMNPQWVTALAESLSHMSADSNECNGFAHAHAVGVSNSNTAGRGIRNLSRSICGMSADMMLHYKKDGDFFSGLESFWFYDQETLKMVNDIIQPDTGRQRIGLIVDILDASGNNVDQRCTEINTTAFFEYDHPRGVVNLNDRDMLLRPTIHAQKKIKGNLNVDLSNLSNYDDIARIKLSVADECYI
jgi:hypothetical protein